MSVSHARQTLLFRALIQLLQLSSADRKLNQAGDYTRAIWNP
jgi:hypothetical protein